jgi:8-oxo-dGTP pyrophosphatase MutT (NUDIX family)
MWNGLWGSYSGNQYKSEESFSLEKYNSLKNGVRFREYKDKDKGDPLIAPSPPKYTIDTIISESTTRWTETEWGFPKGRRNYHEKDVVCALRECLEETGYEILAENIIQNIAPYEEVFMGSDMKCYKHKYYLAYMDIQHSQLKTHDSMEVSDMRWMTYDEFMKTIRPYNLEKKTIITRVNRLLQEYRLT